MANDNYAYQVNPVDVREEPLFKPHKLKVVCIGAGFSGLTLAYKHKYEWHMEDSIDLTIYEKNTDVGGTWLENRYPGVACDVPAHAYTFPFEPNPDWTEFYASGPEIWEYIKKTTEKYKLSEKVQFNSKILGSTWVEAEGRWKIRIQQGKDDTIIEDFADILVNGTGFLNQWRWPKIEGLHNFTGALLHSARWDSTADWTGKRIAIIGNGSSAIQILPKMQRSAKHITTYVRNPTWISANFISEFARDGKNFKYSEEEKKKFRNDPVAFKNYRADMEDAFNKQFMGFIKDSAIQKELIESFDVMMRERLGNDPELCDRLIPDFHVGCRRLTPGDGYLEALKAENVRVNFNGIDKITAKGILDKENKEEEFDIIVCATGFNVSFSPSWKVLGGKKGDLDLAKLWGDSPEAYFGICIPQFPNYFMFTGPNSPVGHGSLLAVIDATAEFVLRWCDRIASTGIKSIRVSEEATREYNDYIQGFLKRTVWTSTCRSWYKNNTINGKVTAMYGGSVVHFKHILESFRVEDFAIQYKEANRFRFMGDGFTSKEHRGDDLGYYLRR